MITAALQCALGECEKDAVGSKIAGGVVAGRRWQQSRAVGALGSSAFKAKARHGLRHLLPAAAMAEWPIGAVAVDRGIDDARPECRDLFRPEAELGNHARPVALREHIGLSYQRPQTVAVLSLQQIEETATLAVAGIEDVLGDLWQALSRYHQHVGAMLSQCTCSHWPG